MTGDLIISFGTFLWQTFCIHEYVSDWARGNGMYNTATCIKCKKIKRLW